MNQQLTEKSKGLRLSFDFRMWSESLLGVELFVLKLQGCLLYVEDFRFVLNKI